MPGVGPRAIARQRGDEAFHGARVAEQRELAQTGVVGKGRRPRPESLSTPVSSRTKARSSNMTSVNLKKCSQEKNGCRAGGASSGDGRGKARAAVRTVPQKLAPLGAREADIEERCRLRSPRKIMTLT